MLALLPAATVASSATLRMEAAKGDHRIVLSRSMRDAVRRFDATFRDHLRPTHESLPETDRRVRGLDLFITRVARPGERVVPNADVEPFRQLWFLKDGNSFSW